MIIMRLSGGLGNQMFQYALGRRLALKNRTSLWLDLGFYTSGEGTVPRSYRLDNFRVKQRLALVQNGAMSFDLSPRLRRYLSRKSWPGQITPVIERGDGFDVGVMESVGSVYLDGYWQTEKYFIDIADTIRADFGLARAMTPSRQAVAARIKAAESVSIHVRRTDYVTNASANAVHGTCSPEWYAAAIDQIAARVDRPHFFVFSDDPAWARANLSVPQDAVFIDPDPDGREFEDLHLMALCQHHIIANSTFSWWGAWLNPSLDKKIIAPARWFAIDRDTSDRLPEAWLRL